MIFSVPLYWKKININYEVGKSTAAVSICRPEINTLAWSGHKLREGGVGKGRSEHVRKICLKTKRSLYFFCILFFSYFPSFFVIHQRLNTVAILLTVCTTCSGFLWLRLLYFFVLFVLLVLPFQKIIALCIISHPRVVYRVDGENNEFFFFFKRDSHCTSVPVTMQNRLPVLI